MSSLPDGLKEKIDQVILSEDFKNLTKEEKGREILLLCSVLTGHCKDLIVSKDQFLLVLETVNALLASVK